MEILTAGHLERPEDGFGLQQVVLEDVAAGTRGPTALMWTSSRYVAATHLETRLPGFADAVEHANGLGFPVLVRNSGGGAVAANEGSISFSLTFPVSDLRHGLYERYEEGAEVVISALRQLGIEAEAGEVEGEFCPGAYSVRVGNEMGIKAAGLAQRVTRRAARLEALILVAKTADLVPVLEVFYGALGLPFRPQSVGDLGSSVPEVIEALSAEVRERYGGKAGYLDGAALDRARSLRGRWRRSPEGFRPGPRR